MQALKIAGTYSVAGENKGRTGLRVRQKIKPATSGAER
jgi:hypothetical protein